MRRKPRSKLALAGILLAGLAVLAVVMYLKPALQTMLTPGTTIRAEFADNYRGKIFANENTVKLAGLTIGKVSGVEETDSGTAVVSMKVDDDVLDKIGPEPTALLSPRTVLGSVYSIELTPGGGAGRFDEEATIPVERTALPVELDRILESLPQPTRESLQNVVGRTDETLAADGSNAIRDLVRNAPPALAPTGGVLDALQGTRPGEDLPRLVGDLESTADVLTRQDGQLGGIVDDLGKTSRALGAQSGALGDTVGTLPATLQETRDGLRDLGGTLDRLTVTARNFTPAAEEVEPLLSELNPVLEQARPLVADLRPVLADARPAVEELVPTSDVATGAVDDVRGPVLDRINGPVLDAVLNTYQGSGPFEGSGDGFQADHRFYEELGYLVTNLDRGSMTQDSQGSLLSFQAGAGAESVGGFERLSLPDLVGQLGRAAGGPR
ncbi:MCE family protein [Pseudonocardia sp. P1]